MLRIQSDFMVGQVRRNKIDARTTFSWHLYFILPNFAL